MVDDSMQVPVYNNSITIKASRLSTGSRSSRPQPSKPPQSTNAQNTASAQASEPEKKRPSVKLLSFDEGDVQQTNTPSIEGM